MSLCRYVVGFMFGADFDKVALIRKTKPNWQAGLLNGLGGKIEIGESPERAMVREFIEEAGVLAKWEHFACLCGGNNNGELFKLECFWSVGDLSTLVSKEVEKIEIVNLSDITPIRKDVIGNLPWLIALALDCASGMFGPIEAQVKYGTKN